MPPGSRASRNVKLPDGTRLHTPPSIRQATEHLGTDILDPIRYSSLRMTDQTGDRAAFLKEPLPEAVLALVEQRVGRDDDLLVSMPADMLPSGEYGESWLAVSRTRLATVAMRNGDPEIISLHDIKEIDEVSVAAGVGNSVLQAKQNGNIHRVLRFSNARRAEFSQAASLIDKWVKESEWDVDSVNIRRSVCPRCLRPLPKGMDICQDCLDKGKLLRRSLSYVRPYRGLVLGVILFMTFSSVLALLPPFLGRYMVDKVITPLQNSHLILPLALAMLATYVIQSIVEGVTRYLSAKIGTRAIYDVRGSMFRRLQEMSLSFYAKKQTGALIARVNQDTRELHTLLVEFIPFGVNMLFMTVGILALLLYLSWFLTLCVLVPIIAMVFVIRRVFPQFHLFWGRYYEKRSRLSAYVTDVITGVRVVKAFAQEPSEITRFDEKSGDLRDAAFNAARKMAKTIPILQALAMAGAPIVWLVGAWMVFAGQMTLGDIIAYNGLVMMLFRPIFILSRLAELIPHSLAAASRVFDIMDADPEIADSPDAEPMTDAKGQIELREVSFGYEPHKKVLHDVSARIKPKEMIGLVGHSGAGKTTVVNLICRFYDVDDGEVLIDGVNVRDIRYDDLRNLMGIVPQETFLLNGSIADNIAYARPDAGPIDIIHAARVANAHDFIVKKPDGYDTMVEEGGKNLSVGEKQRIAIARAVLCDPRILLLDEATASVDVETENQIQEALERLTSERTTIVIAHRLSTLRNAHRLLVLEKGRLTETGTHEELMAKEDGVYRKLADLHSQLSSLSAIER